MVEPIQDKVQKLAETLFKSGIAASESEAKRMAESMIETENEVNETFEEKKQNLTANTSGKEEKEYGVNPVDGSPVNKVPEVPKNEYVQGQELTPNEGGSEPAQQTPAEPVIEQEKATEQIVPDVPLEEPSEEKQMTPEEFTAQQINLEGQQVQDAVKTSSETTVVPETPQQELPTSEESSLKEEPLAETPAEPVIEQEQPAVESQEHSSEEKKDLPDLNPLSEENPEEDKEKEEERKKKIESMEESKVDLTKIFKV